MKSQNSTKHTKSTKHIKFSYGELSATKYDYKPEFKKYYHALEFDVWMCEEELKYELFWFQFIKRYQLTKKIAKTKAHIKVLKTNELISSQLERQRQTQRLAHRIK